MTGVQTCALPISLLTGGGDLKLAPGESLTLTYEPSGANLTESDEEGWYLVAGRSLPSSATVRTKAPRGSKAVPTRFALHESQPNPFSARSTIRFDLPVGAMARLEVFDLGGRRVTVLADRYFAAGFHAVEWDRRTGEGGLAGPGVYFSRIQAGPFRDRKKMILLP